MLNLQLCHWWSQLFDLHAPSSTDVAVLLLNQPNNYIRARITLPIKMKLTFYYDVTKSPRSRQFSTCLSRSTQQKTNLWGSSHSLLLISSVKNYENTSNPIEVTQKTETLFLLFYLTKELFIMFIQFLWNLQWFHLAQHFFCYFHSILFRSSQKFNSQFCWNIYHKKWMVSVL